ncbi:uncharacterized protein LOC115880200 [Sitophilus oryzae]|uniref:Uncharacterized protein LOC115880200 n=1 Tax=Sitophilus oryzae TaxID=7048 RepID=A0A6J2XNV5_SITOR|nr:uncharacterized protein LOC115880200 [Sitophilus oryzae]
MKYLFDLLVILLIYIGYSTACNGWSAKIVSYKNCVDNGIITLPTKGLKVVLDKDCNIYVDGCLEITKSYKSAKGSYHIKKPPLPMIDGDMDFCELDKQIKSMPDAQKAIDMFGLPVTCPVNAGKICAGAEKKFSITKYKNQLGMAAGTSTIKVEVEHDVGKSCYELEFNLSKVKKG